MITGYTGSDTTVVIPKMIDGKRVVKIEDGAFEGSDITEVCIQYNILEIGVRAFADCKNLEKVTIQEQRIRIAENSFAGCESLDMLELPTKAWFDTREVWNEEKKIYEYIVASPVGESDQTVVVVSDGIAGK